MRRRPVDAWTTEYERRERWWTRLAVAGLIGTVVFWTLVVIVAVHFIRKAW